MQRHKAIKMAKDSHHQLNQVITSKKIRNSDVWNCGSTLYDSYELTTFTRQLDAAVTESAAASRSMSMPHMPARAQPASPRGGGGRKRGRIPRLLQKLFMKLLRLRPTAAWGARCDRWYRAGGLDECYSYGSGAAGSSWSGALTSIPEESPEKGSPEAGPSTLRKAKSERFVREKTASGVHVEVLL